MDTGHRAVIMGMETQRKRAVEQIGQGAERSSRGWEIK